MLLIVLLLTLALVTLSLGLVVILRWGEGRRLALFVHHLQAEQRIDEVTRNTISRMRETALGRDASYRGPRP